jgi:thiol-disulfide isomerase/thioredoxin
MNRRTTLLLAFAGAAAAGSGYALWREVRSAPEAGVKQLFAATLEDASGQPQPISQWQGKLLVVNFWATWCPPCVEEMPMLDQIRARYRDRGVEIIGIGIDSADKIRAYQQKFGFNFPLLIANSAGSAVSRALGNEGGVLPYTVLVTPEQTIRTRWIGRVPEDELRSALESNLRS